MKAPRTRVLLVDIAIAVFLSAGLYVWLVGPIEIAAKVRGIDWEDPVRPLRIAAGLLLLRLALPLLGRGWKRVRDPVGRVLGRVWVWVPLVLILLAIWPVARWRARELAGAEVEASRERGFAQIGLATRSVLGSEEASGFALPPDSAGRTIEMACGIDPAARELLGSSRRALEATGAVRLGSQSAPRSGRQLGACEIERNRWTTLRLDLPDRLDPDARLFFDLTGADAAPLAPLVHWSRPRLLPEPDPSRWNLVIVSVDTLRADHLGAYGYRRPVSPNIDRLAARGAVFERALSQSPWTTPSHMSLFTSLFPTVHGVDSPTSNRQRRLSEDKRPLALLLAEGGYATAAFTGSGSISAVYGFWRGFDVYDETDKDDPARGGEDISGVFEKASRWLVDHRDLPFFLFFHTYEVHAPFVHETFLGEVPADDRTARLTALYDGDILHADGFLGQLLSLLEGLGISERTIVVLLSDHGEELAPRYPGKRFGHGHTVYDDLLHVPLIVAAPGLVPAGMRVGETVLLLDVMPTLLELMGIEPPEGLQGKSFAPALRRAPIAPRSGFAEATNYGPERKALQVGHLKYIRTYPREERPAREIPVPVPDEELFDLAADPEERRSLLASGGADLQRLRAQLEAIVAANLARRGAATEEDLDEETLRRLRALGYIQ